MKDDWNPTDPETLLARVLRRQPYEFIAVFIVGIGVGALLFMLIHTCK